MAVSVKITLLGYEELERALNYLSPAGIRKIHKRTLIRAGVETRKISKSEYLRGPRPTKLDRVSGQLRQSIDYAPTDPIDYVEIGTDKVYGAAWELGLVPKKGGGTHDARQFIEPAVDDLMPKYETILYQEIEKAVK